MANWNMQRVVLPGGLNSIAVILTALLWSQVTQAADTELSSHQIQELEKQLFETGLPVERLTSLLNDLEQPDRRAAAKAELSRTALPRISAIIALARDCTNLEARQACADIVETLDASYRTTETGKQLSAWYRNHARDVLPAAWQEFQANPYDHRAVAVLMSVDSQVAYDWLKTNGKRHDSLRFLLLRIREFGRDYFAFKNLPAHSMSSFRLVIRSVYPFPHARANQLLGTDVGEVHAEGIHRVVGHVVLKRISAFGRVWPKGFTKHASLAQIDQHQPIIEKVDVDSRWICMCRYASAFKPGQVEAAWLRFPVTTYSSNLGRTMRVEGKLVPVAPSTSSTGRGERFEIVVSPPLPMLARVPMALPGRNDQRINGSQSPLRWMRPLLPAAYHSYVSPSAANGAGPIPETMPLEAEIVDVGELPDPKVYSPGKLGALADNAPTIVILPARVSPGARKSAGPLADAVVDHLAIALDRAAVARIVNRDELDRVLRERSLSATAPQKLLAFDVMLRLNVETDRFVPRARLTLIELSTGSALIDEAAPWPVRQQDLKRWVTACQKYFRNDKSDNPRGMSPVKVRLTPVLNVTGSARMKPLGVRAAEFVLESLTESPQAQVVEHLEAATSKEEALLLSMGLGRLAGGRQFNPESDYTIELRIEEKAGVGKTFEETPIKLGLRIRVRSEAKAEWHDFAGNVGEFDALVAQLWDEASRRIAEVPPKSSTDLLAGLAERRQQAQNELSAAKKSKNASVAVQHAAAAVKLDPTSEQVFSDYLDALWQEYLALSSEPGRISRVGRLLSECRIYLDRFGSETSRTAQMYRIASAWAAPSFQLNRGKPIGITDEVAEILSDRKFILDAALNVDVKDYVKSTGGTFFDSSQAFTTIYRGMQAIGRPAAERDVWLDDVIEKTGRQVSVVSKLKSATLFSYSRDRVLDWLKSNHLRLVISAASLAVDEGRTKRARLLTDRAMELTKIYKITDEQQSNSTERMLFKMARRHILLFDDPEYLEKFDSQFARPKLPALPISIRLTPPAAWFTQKRPAPPRVKVKYSRPDSGPTGSNIWPLAKTKDRLYILLHTRPVPRFSYIPLNEDGSPQGKEVVTPGRRFGQTWDTITKLPEAPLRPAKDLPFAQKELRITSAKFWRDRLFVGTTHHGLLVFNPQDESWSVYGPEQGLLSWSVESIFPIDETTLYCTTLLTVGHNRSRDEAHFTLEVPEGKVTLVHRTDRAKKRFYDYRFESIWKNGNKWSGWSGNGAIADIFDPDPKLSQPESSSTYSKNYSRNNDRLKFVSLVAKVGERRFVWWDKRVCEIAIDGRIIRSWRGWRDEFVNGSRKLAVRKNEDSPFRNPSGNEPPLVAVGDYLAIFNGELTLFDPKTETWLGPMLSVGSSGFGTEKGIWGVSEFNFGTRYVALKDMLAAAKQAGFVWTKDSYQKRKREYIEKAKPFDRGLYLLQERDFETAYAQLKQVDTDDPNRSDVLLLLGGLHEANYVQPHGAAEQYFLRLTKHEDPDAVYSGLRRLVDFYLANQRWQDAQDCLDRMTSLYELNSYQTREFTLIGKELARRLAAGKAN